ncbi:helicase-like protein, putative [Leishmania tarentolae]|uniref:Helicase-like protein, putative n=1 Tax=Leishmania tarentolae TaxID=5689 RepID=A0A640KHC6_LEITA|nr:helicase-like protein, putative [Leishmania tarentolae]
MAHGGEDVFFVASSSSGEEEDDCQEFAYVEAPVSPTMEDILFGLAPPKPRSTPQSQAQHQQTFPSPPLTHGVGGKASMIEEDDAESGLKESVAAQHRAPGSKCSADQDGEAVLYAGGSPCAMPARQSTPPPRSLDELRRMTSSEVREELERFFVRKDADAKYFKSIEAALLGGGSAADSPSAAVAGAASGKECVSYTVRPTREELLARDRCRRLVNVSNWNAAVGGYSQWDVLLPSALLQDCVMAPTDASAGQAAVATAASSGRQSASSTVSTLGARRTLRPHQVEGIRFLWSVLAEGPAGQVPAVGCILAHTMGLGKTAQVVVFLHLFMAAFPRCQGDVVSSSSSLREARVLIVIPKSTQSGWKREFRTWSACFPEENRLRPISLDEGLPARQRIRIFSAWRRDGGVLLIGYEALVRLLQLVGEDTILRPQSGVHSSTAGIDGDAGRNGATQPTAHAFHLANYTKTMSPQQRRSELQARRNDEGGMTCGGDADPFTELVVCDEAHRLKSVHLNVVTALRSLHPLRRLLLTGTPLQNHLREYWAMMDFCVHKYFSRKRFQEYFIQPIEASASTRASEKEVDLARKKTFTLIKEVRHFVQRVDSTPLRAELPPLHEYIVVVPPSPLQKELYRRFIRLVQHDGSQKLQFLPAVSYSGKIAAHPQLLFQMRGQFGEAKDKITASSTQGMGSSGLDPQRSARDYHTAGIKRSNSGSSHYWDSSSMTDDLRRPHQKRHQEAERSTEGISHNTMGDSKDGTRVEEQQEALVIVDSDAGSTSSSRSDDGNDEEHVFARATQQSFSSVYSAASLTYEELCVPPSPNYTPLLEDGVKLLVAMRLVAAAIARDEKVLLFSLSTQLLTFLESMIAKVNIEWCRPVAASQRQKRAQLPRPIRYCRLDGSHRAAQRAAMLEAFDRPDGPDLFLLSIKAGGVGITVTAATRVILVDTSFNPADDQQAIGRAYRFGQTRPVYVYRLMCYPTLEYSIFVQKLAKEWLFKTVIEESSVKRDGLSGMHLRELFSLLTKTAKVLEKPLSATHAQTLSTQEVLREDPMLGVVQAEVLYAQRYEMFLEHKMDDRYGAAEEAFYHDYCRNRLFDTADDEDAEKQRATELQRRRQQRADEAAQVQVQSKTLTTMVDNLIRSRAGAESQLARLLTAMGLYVDPITGRVQLRRDDANMMSLSGSSEARRHTAAPLLLEDGGEVFAPSPVQFIGGADAYQGNQQLNGGAGTYASHSTPQTAVLLLDSDEESQDVPVPPNAHEDHTGATLSVTANAERISATLARQPYAPYRPGSSPAYAVDIDNDGSK